MAVDKVVYESVSQKEKNEEIPVLPIYITPRGWGARHTQALLLFISLSIGYSMRAQLSVSLVAMTSNSTLTMWYPNFSADCLYPGTDIGGNDTNNEIDTGIKAASGACSDMAEEFKGWNVYRVYKWSKATHEMILFSFFVGYTSMMLPMGLLAQKYGGKITIMIALGVNGVMSLATPWMPIIGGWLGVCVCRLLQGMTQAALYPSIHTMLGKWAPLSEIGRLSSLIYTGSQFGTVLAFQVAGIFAGSPTLGWPATFWFLGILSLTSFGLLAWLGASTPYDHPSISSEEFSYITGQGTADIRPKKPCTPWKQILTCPAIWGIISAQAGSTLGYIFILTQIPLYMSKVLKIDIKNNGLLSSLPYISMYFTSITFGYVADWVANKKYMSILNIRRVSNTIGMVVASVFLVGYCYVTSATLAVILLVLCLASHSGVHAGFHINSIDLAPNFAGPIMAVGNMLSNLTSLAIPLAVSSIIGDVTNQHKWQILFLIVACAQTLSNLVFVVFARGTVLPWNQEGNEDTDDTAIVSSAKRKSRSILDARHSIHS